MSSEGLSQPSQRSTRSNISTWLFSRQAIEVLEAIAGVLAVGLLDYFLPTDLGLHQFDLYIMWVVVLGIAARYGGLAGYIVSFLAAAMFDLLIYVHADPYDATSPHQAIQPLLLFASGILVSELVRSHKRNAEEAKEKLRDAKATTKLLQEQYTLAVETKDELERRIANQPLSIGVVSEFATRMAGARPQDLYPALLDLLQNLFGVGASALYLLDNRVLRLVVGQPEAVAGRALTIPPDHALVARALRERRVVTMRDLVAEHGPAAPARNLGLAAGPLFAADGQFLGVIIIEQMPFFKFTESNLRLFEQVLTWMSRSMQNAWLVEGLLTGTR
ncbi:MAG: GAF domain-containing protein [Ktedonobacterales bacterium]|nr:GAF domain-containing protein [Ktedonobacterales bacterium]